MKRILSALLVITSMGVPAQAQVHLPRHEGSGMTRIAVALPFREANTPEQPDDPGYGLYRQGYNCILEEQWEQARKIFAEVIAKHPKSEYVDDAQYWSAYALMHTDRAKALEAYRAFLREHRSSSYYTDALADINQLKINNAFSSWTAPFVAVTSTGDGGASYYIAVAPHAKGLGRQVRIMSSRTGPLVPEDTGPHGALKILKERELDPELRLRIEIVSAIGRSHEDQKSFDALKEIVLDRSQPSLLRIVAINSIAEFRKHDALPIFVEVARNDTVAELQNTAIDFIGYTARDKNRSIEALEELFDTLPPERTDQLASALFAIADVGNDRAVDFLARVAKTNPNYDLRSDAVFYLSSIGSERARAALVDIYHRE
jgi:tetratricopeptide (TPR) repeat protein